MAKEIVFLINCMLGGGAEKVMTALANDASAKGYKVTLMLTGQRLSDAVGYTVSPAVEFLSLTELAEKNGYRRSLRGNVKMKLSRYRISLAKRLGKTPADSAVLSRYVLEHEADVSALKDFLSSKPDATVVAFLNHSIQLALLALDKLSNRLIISERGNPENHSRSKVASMFIRKYYSRTDVFVFQTEMARDYYSPDLRKKGIVIPNMISGSLPDAYTCESRQKKIVNFCRISHQKNLPLLINAFADFHRTHPDYVLEIIGDANGSEANDVLGQINDIILENGIEDAVSILPFDRELHSKIIDYAMFVSSSDFEGMSNSMLEAMAIGLPTVCTDCPIGGARAVIKDHENGILVPIKDRQSLCRAMCKVADDPALAKKMSENAAKLREELSPQMILGQWEALY